MAMANIFGKMAAYIKETLSRESDMDMVFGKTNINNTGDIIGWIKKKGLGFIPGKINKPIKDSLGMILEKATVNFIQEEIVESKL